MIEATERCLTASTSMDKAFKSAQRALLEAIPSLLACVTDPTDQEVVEGVLRDLAAERGHSGPCVTLRWTDMKDIATLGTSLTSRIARDFIVAVVRIIREQRSQHRLRGGHNWEFAQAMMDTVVATDASLDESRSSKVGKLLAALAALSGVPGFASHTDDNDLHTGRGEKLDHNIMPKSRTLH
jgi:hypothetical protein